MTNDPSEEETLSAEEPGGFTQVPDSLLLNTAITDGAYRLYAVLKHHARQTNASYPGRKLLARELGVKSLRTIDNRVDELRTHGYLKKTHRFRAQGGQASNHYHLLFYPNPRLTAPEMFDSTVAPLPSRSPESTWTPTHASVPEQSGTPVGEGVQPVAPRNELHGAAGCEGPVQESAQERSTSPSSTHLPPAPDSTGVGSQAALATGGGEGLEIWADAVIAHLPASLYPSTRSQTSQMRALLIATPDLATIPAAQLADKVARMRDLPDIVTHPVGLLRSRLADIAPPRRSQPALPEWCGECEERTRQIWDRDTDKVRRCPTCHPHRPTTGGPA